MNAFLPPLFFKKTLHFFLIIVLMNSVGCATRYNPLQSTWTGEANQEKETNPILEDCRPPADGALYPYSLGVHCTERVRDAYLDAGVDDVVLSDATAFALIPLSLAAIGVGVAGVNGGNTLTGLALGSGTLLGWGTWMTSPTRRDIYGLGAEAMSCVISASEPLNIPQARITSIKSNKGALIGAMNDLYSSIKKVEENDYAKTDGVKIETENKLNSAKTSFNEAKEALKSVNLAIDTFSRAGQTVWNATMAIHTKVVTLQLKNGNDLRNFSDHLEGTIYGNFQDLIGLSSISIPFVKKEKDASEFQSSATLVETLEQTQMRLEYESLMETLDKAQMKVMGLIGYLNADLQAITVVDLNSSFTNCMNPLKTFQQPKKLLVSPRILQMTPGQEQKIRIKGGAPPFTIFGEWPTSVDLAISPTMLSGPGTVSIQAGTKDKLPTDKTYRLYVEDSEGNEKAIRIIISPATASTIVVEPPAGKTDATTAANLIVDALNSSAVFTPEAWHGVTTAPEWKKSPVLEGFLFSFTLDDKTQDNTAKLAVLQKATGVVGTAPIQGEDSGDIELTMTPEELQANAAAIQDGKGLATPVGVTDDNTNQDEVALEGSDVATTPGNPILDALNNSDEFKPEAWNGVSTAKAWKVSRAIENYLFSFMLDDSSQDNASKLAALQKYFGGVVETPPIQRPSGNIELTMTSEEFQALVEPVQLEEVATPIIMPEINEFKDQIVNALNTSAKVKPSAWNLIADNGQGVWKRLGDNEKNFQFSLGFKDPDAVSAATQQDEKIASLTTLGGVKKTFLFETKGSELILIIPKKFAVTLKPELDGKRWP